jgi:hypothetical protein
MVDRIAGDAAYAEQLDLGFRVVADHADVRTAEAVNLRRHRHRMTFAAPEQVEHSAERQPPLDLERVVSARADRDRL